MIKKTLKVALVLSISFCNWYSSFSQNIMEGSKGNSSLDYSQYGGGIISFNGTDKKIELAYINYKFKKSPFKNDSLLRYSETPYWYGFTVSGKAVNGYSTIFSKGKVYPSTDITLKAGYRIFGNSRDYLNDFNVIREKIKVLAIELADPHSSEQRKKMNTEDIDRLTKAIKAPSELWLIARGGYNVSKFYLYDGTTSFDRQLQSTRFDALFASIGVNYWNPRLFDSKLIFLAGLTIGVRKQNNVDDLDEISAEDVSVSTNQQTNTTRSVKSTQVAFEGSYQTFTTIPINFDLYFKPHDFTNVAFSFYGRINSFNKINGVPYVDGRQYPVNLGIGVFLLNENWLANPAGGVTFELKDSFKTLSSSATFKDRLVINFVTRINILKYRE